MNNPDRFNAQAAPKQEYGETWTWRKPDYDRIFEREIFEEEATLP